ncbi:hypothetical protein GYA93_04345 [Gordonia desulfuricans]|uniref:Uncharacterized protein n=1 Tax=Gordonia desulfuricans TaxID=89051 RepID=A0A7K3LL90_9ACTN|nr:hypothetical protein [Gordonia desulfuricans]
MPALDPSWTPVTVTARPAPRTLQYPPPPAAVDFSVSPLQRYDPRAADDHLLVSWRNLRSGKTGTLVLRPRQLPEFPTPRNTSHRLPTSAVAPTGSGPVVATVTVIRGSGKATRTVSVTPGATAIDVP